MSEPALPPDAEPAEEHSEKDPAGEQKSYETILEQEIQDGLRELERPTGGLALSSLSAGLDIGFSVLAMGAILIMASGELPESVVGLLVANAYSIGFVFVVLGRSELFTEHTTLAVLPVIDGRASLPSLLRLWGVVYVANLAGAALFAAFLSLVGPALGSIEPAAFEHLARRTTDHPSWVILCSAVLAGWMMGLLTWLVAAGRETISKIFFVWLIPAAIGLGHLHHSIVGSVEVLSGVFLGFATWGEFCHFLAFATLGNALGGVIFVALLKHGHASRGRGGRRFRFSG